jgi:hypothetical protein
MVKQERGRGALLAALLIVAVMGVWAAWGWWGVAFLADRWAPGSSEANAERLARLGQAGDLFGGISALFAALAFAGVAIGAYLQHRQLADARRAVAQSETAALEARERLDEQYARQVFQPLFFKLVELVRAEATGMRLLLSSSREGAQPTFPLDSTMKWFRAELAKDFQVKVQRETPSGWVDRLTQRYLDFYHLNESQLGPYFRTLYRALKLVRNSRLPLPEQVEYANMLRGLLSRDELLLLMLNCCATYGRKMKPLVEEFGVLKHISQQATDDTEMDRKLAKECFAAPATMSYRQRTEYWEHNPKPQFLID